jgi:hypothetical protein
LLPPDIIYRGKSAALGRLVEGSFEIFAQAEAIALRYKKIDLSDALQIVSIKHGKLKHGLTGQRLYLSPRIAALKGPPEGKDCESGIVKIHQLRQG